MEIIVEGDGTDFRWVEVDAVQIFGFTVPTMTFTPTPTRTASPTPDGPTITPSPTPTASGLTAAVWFEGFDTVPGQQPNNWFDETQNSTYNAEITTAYPSGAAAITRTAEDVWGKVLSTPVLCDVNMYPYLELNITAVSPATTPLSRAGPTPSPTRGSDKEAASPASRTPSA